MITLSILLTLCFVCHLGQLVNGVGLHGLHFKGLEEPSSSSSMSMGITESWIQQPLDHFNPRENRTWLMRYYENSRFYKKGGPILIMIGGEWEIGTGFLETGLMYDIGSTHDALMYYTEHRFYGKSKPTENISSESLQYLSVDQALADLAYFIEAKKKEEGFDNSTVIVFGGSYAGGMATWVRLKYPHLVQGALASSAPVLSKTNFYEYYEVVGESLRRHSEQCAADVKVAFDEVEELLHATNGSARLKSIFNLCDLPKVNSPNDVGFFMNYLAEAFAGIVQYNKAQGGQTTIGSCCEKMTAKYLGSPLQRLAYLVSKTNKCLENSYEKYVKVYAKENWNAQPDISRFDVAARLWYYQTCTEFGNYQTTDSNKTIFGTLFPLNFFTDLCTDLYGDYYNSEFLNERVHRTNIMYGGLHPDLRKVIFTNGDVDPWHVLSILHDLNKSSPAILVKGASHCGDLYSDMPTDIPDLIKARAKVREIISGWIVS